MEDLRKAVVSAMERLKEGIRQDLFQSLRIDTYLLYSLNYPCGYSEGEARGADTLRSQP
jgi:hypothetical protein